MLRNVADTANLDKMANTLKFIFACQPVDQMLRVVIKDKGSGVENGVDV